MMVRNLSTELLVLDLNLDKQILIHIGGIWPSTFPGQQRQPG